MAIVPTPDGGEDCTVFDFATGEMTPDRSYFEQVLPGSGKDVDSLTQAEFEQRLAACRAAASERATAQVKTWAEALCATTGALAEVSAALSFTGPVSHDIMTVEPTPYGFTKVRLKQLEKSVALELRAAGRQFTRAACGAAFGAPSSLPLVDATLQESCAYHVDVPGAPRYCTIFVGIARDGAARELLLRRDWL